MKKDMKLTHCKCGTLIEPPLKICGGCTKYNKWKNEQRARERKRMDSFIRATKKVESNIKKLEKFKDLNTKHIETIIGIQDQIYVAIELYREMAVQKESQTNFFQASPQEKIG